MRAWRSASASCLTAIWWFVFALPVLRKVPEPPAEDASSTAGLGEAFQVDCASTLSQLRRYRQAFLLLIAVSRLQRRRQHDLPSGDDLRHGDRSAAELADHRDPSRAVRRRALRLPLRLPGDAHRYEAGDPDRPVGLPGDLDLRLLRDDVDALLHHGDPRRHGAGRRAVALAVALRQHDPAREVVRVLRLLRCRRALRRRARSAGLWLRHGDDGLESLRRRFGGRSSFSSAVRCCSRSTWTRAFASRVREGRPASRCNLPARTGVTVLES